MIDHDVIATVADDLTTVQSAIFGAKLSVCRALDKEKDERNEKELQNLMADLDKFERIRNKLFMKVVEYDRKRRPKIGLY